MSRAETRICVPQYAIQQRVLQLVRDHQKTTFFDPWAEASNIHRTFGAVDIIEICVEIAFSPVMEGGALPNTLVGDR